MTYVSKELSGDDLFGKKVFGVKHWDINQAKRGNILGAIYEWVVNAVYITPEVQIADITDYADVLKEPKPVYRVDLVGTWPLRLLPFETREDAHEYIINNLEDKNFIDIFQKQQEADKNIDVSRIEAELKGKTAPIDENTDMEALKQKIKDEVDAEIDAEEKAKSK